jgi:hypothetical protein
MKLRTTVLVCAMTLLVCFFGLTAADSQTSNMTEGFEAGGKTSYAAANVALGSGQWYMSEALMGNLSTDRKTGAYSARIRDTGFVRMNFNRTGAGTVSVQHAKFGTDANSSWELWQSTNSGGSWSKVGSTVNTTSTTLQTASFNINTTSTIRFETSVGKHGRGNQETLRAEPSSSTKQEQQLVERDKIRTLESRTSPCASHRKSRSSDEADCEGRSDRNALRFSSTV